MRSKKISAILTKYPLVGGLVGVSWALVMFRGVLFASSEVIWADNFDGNLIYWILEWGFHALTQTGEPWNFWHANTFHPMSYSLAVSDSLLAAQIFYSPLRMFGISPVSAVYIASAMTFVTGAVLTDYFGKKIGLRKLSERFALVVAAHCLMPNTMMLYHYQLFGFQLAPGFLLALVWFLESAALIALFWTCLLYCAASCYSTYLAPMLLVVALPICLGYFLPQLSRNGLAATAKRYYSIQNLTVAAFFAGCLYYVQLRPYLELNKNFGRVGYGEARLYSAHWLSILFGKSINSFWYGNIAYSHGDWERTQFLGYTALSILLISVLTLFFRLLYRKESREIRNMTFWLLIFLWIWSLSMGPFMIGTNIRLPFRWMAEVTPGLSNVRAPGRFGMLWGVPLGMLLIFMIREIKRPDFQSILLFIISGMVLFESAPNFKTEPFRRKLWARYSEIAGNLPQGSTLLELPLAVGDNYEVIMNAMDQMKGSTLHWARIVSGYGAKSSPAFDKALDLDRRARQGEMEILEFFDFMSENDFRYLLIHFDQMPVSYASDWRKAIVHCTNCKTLMNKDYLLLDTRAGG